MKYQLVPIEDAVDWVTAHADWFPLFDTAEEAWDYLDENADSFHDVGLDEFEVIEIKEK